MPAELRSQRIRADLKRRFDGEDVLRRRRRPVADSSGRKVAILGYGSQGHAHALNLRDSGVDVRVGLPAASRSRAKAEADGLTVVDAGGSVAQWADVIMVLVPDTAQAALYRDAIAAEPARRARR